MTAADFTDMNTIAAMAGLRRVDPMPTIIDTLHGAAAFHKAEVTARALDPFTLAAAEKVVRDRIATTKWAQDASTLRLAADAIHKLGDAK